MMKNQYLLHPADRTVNSIIIQSLKNYKSAGLDWLTAEILK